MQSTTSIEQRASSHESPTSSSKERDGSIQTLRGVAILLVVLYHALADLPAGRLVTADLDAYDYAGESLRFVRMPLFTVISGFVYAMRPVAADRLTDFAVGKARRVLIPYLAVTAMFVALLLVGIGDSPLGARNIVGYVFVGIEHLWYLPAILVVFAIVALLERRDALRTARDVGAAVAIAAVASLIVSATAPTPLSELLPVATAAYLLPYFLFGLGCRRFGWHQTRPALTLGLAGVVVALGAQHLTLHGFVDLPLGRHGLLATLGGLTSSLLLLKVGMQHRWIARLGGFSMTIYLFHLHGLWAGERLGSMLNFGASGLLLTKVLLALALPIMLDVVAVHHRLGRVALGHR